MILRLNEIKSIYNPLLTFRYYSEQIWLNGSRVVLFSKGWKRLQGKKRRLSAPLFLYHIPTDTNHLLFTPIKATPPAFLSQTNHNFLAFHLLPLVPRLTCIYYSILFFYSCLTISSLFHSPAPSFTSHTFSPTLLDSFFTTFLWFHLSCHTLTPSPALSLPFLYNSFPIFCSFLDFLPVTCSGLPHTHLPDLYPPPE